jgi:hypothetical protein
MNVAQRLMLTAVLMGCALHTATVSAAEPARRTENVIVVTLDGFRWQEFFEGADE